MIISHFIVEKRITWKWRNVHATMSTERISFRHFITDVKDQTIIIDFKSQQITVQTFTADEIL